MLDVAVIGAGPSGLDTAYRLKGRDVAVFEKEPTVGGRSRTVLVDGEPVNLGALYVYLGTETERICNELGIEYLPVQPSTYSGHYKGTTVVAKTDADLVAGLPLSPEGKEDLNRLLATLRDVYGHYSEHGLTEASKDLARVSFAEYLGGRHPEVAEFLRTACVGASTAWPEELSAQYGMRYVASYMVRDPDHRGYIPGGMNEMTLELLRRLGDAVQFGAEVTAVRRAGDAYELDTLRGASRETTEARQVVFAVPGPVVARLAPWLPDWKLKAIEAIPTATTVVLAVVLRTTRESSWDNVYFMPTVGTPFQSLFQGKVGPSFRPLANERTVLYLYAHREPAEAIFDDDDAAITEAWLAHLYRIFPDARGDVTGSVLKKWEHCFAYIRADRLDALELVQRPIDGLHFVGDYASPTAATHGAFGSGDRAAAEIGAVVTV